MEIIILVLFAGLAVLFGPAVVVVLLSHGAIYFFIPVMVLIALLGATIEARIWL